MSKKNQQTIYGNNMQKKDVQFLCVCSLLKHKHSEFKIEVGENKWRKKARFLFVLLRQHNISKENHTHTHQKVQGERENAKK